MTAYGAGSTTLDDEPQTSAPAFKIVYGADDKGAQAVAPAQSVNYTSPFTDAERQRLIDQNVYGQLGYRFVKRAFDIVFSGAVITILAIPSAAVCIAIYTQSPGNPFYVDKRVGRFGKPLGVLKFRSMVTDAGNVEKYFTPE